MNGLVFLQGRISSFSRLMIAGVCWFRFVFFPSLTHSPISDVRLGLRAPGYEFASNVRTEESQIGSETGG